MVLLRRAAEDPGITGLMVDYSDYSLNAAQTEELRENMVLFRDAGKPVYAYIEYATTLLLQAPRRQKILHAPGREICIIGFTCIHPFSGF
jgi:hypothetical protein